MQNGPNWVKTDFIKRKPLLSVLYKLPTLSTLVRIVEFDWILYGLSADVWIGYEVWHLKIVSTLSQRTRGPNCFFLSVCSFVSSLLPGEEERIDQSTTDRAPEPLNLISKPPRCR